MNRFEDFLFNEKVKRVNPDLSRVRSIVIEAKKRKNFIDLLRKNVLLNDETANYFIENVYDVLIELIRAKMFQDGYKAIGYGAHEVEVAYLEQLGFQEKDMLFLNVMRENRNGIKYYGKSYDVDYANMTIDFFERIYCLLLEKLENAFG